MLAFKHAVIGSVVMISARHNLDRIGLFETVIGGASLDFAKHL